MLLTCLGVKDRPCADACPLECTDEGDDRPYINPDECIYYRACVEPCTVNALFLEDELPGKWRCYVEKSRKFLESKERNYSDFEK
jgi:NAD-dependent dihydropyrimidine dehydrogenase PreA subunit